jgi:ribosomal protein S3AE
MAMKKKFLKIELPLLGEETMALGTVETLKGRTIKLDLSRKLRGRSLEVVFALKDIEGKVVGYPKRLSLMKQYIIRMMRKRVNYVEDSFEAQSKDVTCTIKPFLITRKRVSRAIRHSLRKTAKEFLVEYARERTYIDLCESVLYGEVQKEMLGKLKKIYPLSFCEIRVLETKEMDKLDLTIKEKKIRQEMQEDLEDIQEDTEKDSKKDKKDESSTEDVEDGDE